MVDRRPRGQTPGHSVTMSSRAVKGRAAAVSSRLFGRGGQLCASSYSEAVLLSSR